MTQEEKAKAYEEAIERAKNFIENGDERERTIAESIFAGIMEESEDESIRRNIIAALKGEGYYDCDLTNECIAWLEKQGGTKDKLNTMLDDSLSRETKETWNKFLDEQVEPKFKEGNWYQCTKDFFGKGVTFDKNTAYYCAKEGCLQGEYGCHIAIVKDLYDNFKLWTIQDAKVGDVLVDVCNSLDNPLIFIVKDFERTKHELVTMSDYHSFCYLRASKKQEFCIDGWHNKHNIHPATKEQRELLFAKMKEAGYEWDSEKKELKKIEQKPAWSREDEQNLNASLGYIDDEYLRRWLKDAIYNKYEKPAWKPSDGQMIVLNDIIINGHLSNANERILKSLQEQLKKLRKD